jgi:ribulose-bisphosphate carboxylase large chain
VSFRVIAKWLRLAGVDHMHTGTAVGKLEGDPMTVQGYYNVCRDSYTKTDLPRGLFFDMDWCDMKKVMPVASGGIHAGNLARYAACGIDRISIGAVTHSVASLDLSLELEPLR